MDLLCYRTSLTFYWYFQAKFTEKFHIDYNGIPRATQSRWRYRIWPMQQKNINIWCRPSVGVSQIITWMDHVFVLHQCTMESQRSFLLSVITAPINLAAASPISRYLKYILSFQTWNVMKSRAIPSASQEIFIQSEPKHKILINNPDTNRNVLIRYCRSACSTVRHSFNSDKAIGSTWQTPNNIINIILCNRHTSNMEMLL